MAELLEENIVITVSRAVKSNMKMAPLVNDELIASIDAVMTELLGGVAIVEVKVA